MPKLKRWTEFPSVATQDAVVMATPGARLEARDLRHGQVLWHLDGPPGEEEEGRWEPALGALGDVVVQGTRSQVRAVEPRTGRILWSRETQANVDPLSTVAILSTSGEEKIVRLKDGIALWSTSERITAAAEVDGRLYLASGRDVRCVRAVDGVQVWRQEMPLPSMEVSTLLVAGSYVIVGSRNDQEAWTVVLTRDAGRVAGSRLGSSPQSALVDPKDGKLHIAFDHTEIGTLQPEGKFKLTVWADCNLPLDHIHWETRTSLRIRGNHLYALSWDAGSVGLKANCVDLERGNIVWSTPIDTYSPDHSVYYHRASFEVRGDRLIIADVQLAGTGVYVLDRESGNVISSWQKLRRECD